MTGVAWVKLGKHILIGKPNLNHNGYIITFKIKIAKFLIERDFFT